jgi:ribonuclease P protein component
LTKADGIYSLGKKEIIRGYNSFKNILVNSKLITNSFLKLNIQVRKSTSGDKEIKNFKDPLNNVKVGFVVSKRMVKKASGRNRLKRLAREAYRMNRNLLNEIDGMEIYILFGYGESYKDDFVNLDFQLVDANMRMLLLKTLDYLKKQK